MLYFTGMCLVELSYKYCFQINLFTPTTDVGWFVACNGKCLRTYIHTYIHSIDP
jgi:hypothetical protein